MEVTMAQQILEYCKPAAIGAIASMQMSFIASMAAALGISWAGKKFAEWHLAHTCNESPVEGTVAFINLFSRLRQGFGDTPELRWQRMGQCLAAVPPGSRRFVGKFFLSHMTDTTSLMKHLTTVHRIATNKSPAFKEAQQQLHRALNRFNRSKKGDALESMSCADTVVDVPIICTGPRLPPMYISALYPENIDPSYILQAMNGAEYDQGNESIDSDFLDDDYQI